MARLVRMPEVAANAAHAVLVEWMVKPGDRVRAGDAVAGIETDKAMVDLAVEHDGRVGRLLADAGASVAVGAPVAVLLEEGDSQADGDALLDGADATGMAGPQALADSGPAAAVAGIAAAAEAADAGRIFASPLARRLAAEAGLPLAGLTGSGPQGRIVKRDIDAAAARRAGSSGPPGTAALPASASGRAVDAMTAGGAASAEGAGLAPFTVHPHGTMRLTIARRLAESKATVPHFYLKGECRADALLDVRAQFNDAAPQKVSLNDFLIRAAACALRDVPDMNVTWTDDALLRHRDADIGVAVATPGGLYTPIVRAAQRQGVSAISAIMADLAKRARAGRLAPAEYQGGTFGLSNLGMHGVQEFSAIINPPQSAILAVGAARQAPVVDGTALRVGWIMRYTLSVDHRAIDGAVAAQWLARFTHYLERPAMLLV